MRDAERVLAGLDATAKAAEVHTQTQVTTNYVGNHGSMNWNLPTLAMIALLLAGAPAAHPHHSRAMFDMSQNMTLRGIVQEYRWQNPHSQLLVSVSADAAKTTNMETWYVEASSVGIMVSQGWNRTTFKAGDPITVVVHPNRKLRSRVVLLFFAITAEGKRLYRAEHRYPSEVE